MLKPERIPDQPRRRGHIDGESRPAALSLDLLEQLALELLRFDLSLKLLLDLLKLHQLEPAAKLPLQRLDELEHRLVNGTGGSIANSSRRQHAPASFQRSSPSRSPPRSARCGRTACRGDPRNQSTELAACEGARRPDGRASFRARAPRPK